MAKTRSHHKFIVHSHSTIYYWNKINKYLTTWIRFDFHVPYMPHNTRTHTHTRMLLLSLACVVNKIIQIYFIRVVSRVAAERERESECMIFGHIQNNAKSSFHPLTYEIDDKCHKNSIISRKSYSNKSLTEEIDDTFTESNGVCGFYCWNTTTNIVSYSYALITKANFVEQKIIGIFRSLFFLVSDFRSTIKIGLMYI